MPSVRIGSIVLSLEQLRMSLDCDKDDKGKPIADAEGGAKQLIQKAHASPSAGAAGAVAAAAPDAAVAAAAPAAAALPAATVGFVHGDERGPVVQRAAGPRLGDLYWAGYNYGLDDVLTAMCREIAEVGAAARPLVTWELRLRQACSDAAAGLPGRGLYDPQALELFRAFEVRAQLFPGYAAAFKAYYNDPEAKAGPIIEVPKTNLGAYARLVTGPTARSDRLVGFYADASYLSEEANRRGYLEGGRVVDEDEYSTEGEDQSKALSQGDQSEELDSTERRK